MSSSEVPAFEHNKLYGISKHYACYQVRDRCPLGYYLFSNFWTFSWAELVISSENKMSQSRTQPPSHWTSKCKGVTRKWSSNVLFASWKPSSSHLYILCHVEIGKRSCAFRYLLFLAVLWRKSCLWYVYSSSRGPTLNRSSRSTG